MMDDLRNRMTKLIESQEQAEEAEESSADSGMLKQVADQIVVALTPMLPEDDIDAGLDMVVGHLKHLVANKALLKASMKRMNVGTRAKKAAKALVKSV